ncbi:hypothetical protein AD951_05960 [Acetobacter malorum]|uniref:Uncharacterized protein n=1 Tax=Acetobacter malorum TaxID=178901 RepID=A0A149UNT9_9PROT|nr:hypothetical protein [Acetobacter malorum]KXV69558.1 hypothetical protein AD951_05960 [Acetobacter malorum]
MSRQTVIRIGALIIQVAILFLIWQGLSRSSSRGTLQAEIRAVSRKSKREIGAALTGSFTLFR